MGLFFKKKKKIEEVKQEINTNVVVDKHTAQTNCMIIKSNVLPDGVTEYTVKYSIGDRKYMLDGKINTKKHNIESMDIGDVYVLLYDPENPQDAVIKDFKEL